MKFNFFGNKNKPTKDCACGCSKDARNSVRLTDAEIAEDIITGLSSLQHEYEHLCETGCDCSEKLRSCTQSKNSICEFINGRK